ncbi:MAG: hypothetical protein AAF337_03625 [Pseudomonadota bacterium]
MINKTLMACVAVAGLTLASCGDDGPVGASSSAKEIADTYMTELESVASAIESVKSEDDVEAAALAIKAAAKNLEGLTEELDGEISGIKAMRILGSRAGDFMEVQQRIGASLTKLSQENPEMMERISEAMEALPNN